MVKQIHSTLPPKSKIFINEIKLLEYVENYNAFYMLLPR